MQPAKGHSTKNKKVYTKKWCKLARGIKAKWCKTNGHRKAVYPIKI
jgi:hypothetical protein